MKRCASNGTTPKPQWSSASTTSNEKLHERATLRYSLVPCAVSAKKIMTEEMVRMYLSRGVWVIPGGTSHFIPDS